jgi:glycerol kinase
MQFTADITGVELRVSDVADSSARGAAMAAMLGLAAVESLAELAAAPSEVRTYCPQMHTDQVQRLYSGWQMAVRRVL